MGAGVVLFVREDGGWCLLQVVKHAGDGLVDSWQPAAGSWQLSSYVAHGRLACYQLFLLHVCKDAPRLPVQGLLQRRWLQAQSYWPAIRAPANM